MSVTVLTPEIDPSDSASRRHRVVDYSHVRQLATLREQHRQLRRAASGATLGLVLVCLLLGAIAYGETQKYRELLGSRIEERNELRALRASFAELEAQVDGLVRGRIPGLHPLSFDEVLPIDDRYVRNVVFTLARTAEGPSYEYKAVLHNDSEVGVLPDVTLHVFDRYGVEIGQASVASAAGGSAAEQPLYPGEVRSYLGAVPLPPDRSPAYFRLQFH